VAVQIRLAAIVLIAGLLAACTSGDAQPTPSTTSIGSVSTAQTSPSPTQTGPLTTGPNVRPGEKPPELMPEAKQRTVFGATATAVYYFRALDWTIATNDSYLIRQISLPSCAACKRVIDFIASLQRTHDVLRGGRIDIKSFGQVTGHFNYKSDVVIRVVLEQGSETRQSGSAPPSTVAAAGRDTSLVFLNWTRFGWRVAEVAAP
jgi:hypothetical protein